MCHQHAVDVSADYSVLDLELCPLYMSSLSATQQSPSQCLDMQVISFDVKPANVLLDRTGKHAKLADVGLAKILEHSQTMTNMVSLPLLLSVHW